MRKVLSILLISVFLATFALPASALEFLDVDEAADYAKAIGYVSNPDMMVGDETGEFLPEKTVTRAEMAAIVGGTPRQDNNLPQPYLAFSDAPVSHWANAYAAGAGEPELIPGYPDGRFGPDDSVAYEQAVPMVVQAKGYESAGYPNGYLSIAEENGYPEGLSSSPGKSFSSAGETQSVYRSAVDWKASEEILKEAKDRRSTFYGRQNDVKSTGKVYYISNSGDDQNDGLSPDTAWATLDRAFEPWWHLTRDFLKPGDAVLLERGGTWYVHPDDREGLTSEAYNIVDGVTLGAYGEGARPVIRGDLPEANDPAFWSLYYDESGVKIWASAEKLQDCNVIVFNGGEAWAEEVLPHWSTRLNGYSNAAGEPFSVPAELRENLTFCSLLELDGGYTLEQDLGNSALFGTLYLRCDAGNPAQVFDEVAVPQAQTGLMLLTNAAISGLDIRYFTCLAAELSSYDGQSGQKATDCEIGWCGGLISEYQVNDEGVEGVLRPYCAGGAIQVSGSGNSVTDCYIHHCGPMTLILSIHDSENGGVQYKDMTYSGNLIEYCGGVLHIADLAKMDRAGAEGYISDLTYADNMVMYTGEGWVENLVLQIDGPNSNFLSAVENRMGAANNDGIYFINNVFFGAKENLLWLTDDLWNYSGKVNRPMQFSGNVYAQPYGGKLCMYNWEKQYYSGSTADEEEFLKFIGDTEGKIVHIL